MNWNDRIEVTPLGQYVSRLHRADQRLSGLTYPGLHSTDPRVRQAAYDASEAAHNLRGTLQDEMARFGGLRTYGPEPEEDLPEPTEEAPHSCPSPCAVCGIANINGPACFADDCPNRLHIRPRLSREEWNARMDSDFGPQSTPNCG